MSSGAASSQLSQNVGMVSGTQYIVEYEVTALTSGVLEIYHGTSWYQIDSTVGTHALSVVGGSGVTLYFRPHGDSPFIGSIDNVQFQPAEQDRSVNANGLAVHGTITKSAVATGADLVAYSGFSASNHLEQPHQSYMDDVSGDWSITHWGKVIGTSTQSFWEISKTGTDVAGDGSVLAHAASGSLRLYIRGNSGSQDWEITTGFSVSDGMWHLYTYTKVGNVLTVYQDGVVKSTKTLASDGRTYNEATSVTRLGLRSDGSGSPLSSGSLALFRISATAPTAAQIKTIYEAEKPLFQENAQATLYGTSDAVTALAHDDSTNLLHVGTSSGRSVFQGLRRVDNTTTAVGAAISASNGLVVED